MAYQRLTAGGIKAFEGAADLIKEAQRLGMRVAVASSGEGAWVCTCAAHVEREDVRRVGGVGSAQGNIWKGLCASPIVESRHLDLPCPS